MFKKTILIASIIAIIFLSISLVSATDNVDNNLTTTNDNQNLEAIQDTDDSNNLKYKEDITEIKTQSENNIIKNPKDSSVLTENSSGKLNLSLDVQINGYPQGNYQVNNENVYLFLIVNKDNNDPEPRGNFTLYVNGTPIQNISANSSYQLQLTSTNETSVYIKFSGDEYYNSAEIEQFSLTYNADPRIKLSTDSVNNTFYVNDTFTIRLSSEGVTGNYTIRLREQECTNTTDNEGNGIFTFKISEEQSNLIPDVSPGSISGDFNINIINKTSGGNKSDGDKKQPDSGSTDQKDSSTTNNNPVSSPKLKKTTIKTKSKITFKLKKPKKFTITLKSGKKAVPKVKVTLKIKGKVKLTITKKTNKKGKITFNLKKLNKKAKYTAKLTFKKTKTYKASKKTVKIIVK